MRLKAEASVRLRKAESLTRSIDSFMVVVDLRLGQPVAIVATLEPEQRTVRLKKRQILWIIARRHLDCRRLKDSCCGPFLFVWKCTTILVAQHAILR